MNSLVDGKQVAEVRLRAVEKRLRQLPTLPHLTIFTCEPTAETKTFLKRKQAVAERLGIEVNVVEFGSEVSLPEMLHTIALSVPTTNGIVVQLPFPSRINITELLMAVPPSHDVDALLYDGADDTVLPPVVGAIKAIAEYHQITWQDKQVVVVGQGRLVGAPAALWVKAQGAIVDVIAAPTNELKSHLQCADILILGTGVPGLVTRDMIKPGAVIFDAGTSEVAGVLKGDAHSGVIETAGLVTPVPGGIGPVTIAVLFGNLVALAGRQ